MTLAPKKLSNLPVSLLKYKQSKLKILIQYSCENHVNVRMCKYENNE